MSIRTIIGLAIVIMIIVFAPIFFADAVEKFFEGVGVIFTRWTTD